MTTETVGQPFAVSFAAWGDAPVAVVEGEGGKLAVKSGLRLGTITGEPTAQAVAGGFASTARC